MPFLTHPPPHPQPNPGKSSFHGSAKTQGETYIVWSRFIYYPDGFHTYGGVPAREKDSEHATKAAANARVCEVFFEDNPFGVDGNELFAQESYRDDLLILTSHMPDSPGTWTVAAQPRYKYHWAVACPRREGPMLEEGFSDPGGESDERERRRDERPWYTQESEEGCDDDAGDEGYDQEYDQGFDGSRYLQPSFCIKSDGGLGGGGG
ncbi:hypothetical protein BDK51DRAFT_37249 [Blyttiomyces helicus]|uniref:Uncharacterized protein n=1 Tax=Blyttiomyces helicus TaxID=388810 RepID=A0A4P9WLS1_9FUNG|nr:hypothetical protein BDK51DRAFT_37249 [Blyttiomyces helicus]|eukprot:RKO92090.1 hypothetical protein BDK51DRAFT_37249 [Blyttiomyces helicus]